MKVIDGSTVSMPDTVENQSVYPQPKTQKAGCGFPIAKIGVIFSLATGAAVALVIDILTPPEILPLNDQAPARITRAIVADCLNYKPFRFS